MLCVCVKIKVNSLFRADACREITMIMYATANVWWKKTNKDSGCARDLYVKGIVNPNSYISKLSALRGTQNEIYSRMSWLLFSI